MIERQLDQSGAAVLYNQGRMDIDAVLDSFTVCVHPKERYHSHMASSTGPAGLSQRKVVPRPRGAAALQERAGGLATQVGETGPTASSEPVAMSIDVDEDDELQKQLVSIPIIYSFVLF